eukprot:jgi/Botrbrau1/5578/Bobra.97_2s0009.1
MRCQSSGAISGTRWRWRSSCPVSWTSTTASCSAWPSADCLDQPHFHPLQLRILFENGEKIAGMTLLRQLHNKELSGGGDAAPLLAVVEWAGQRLEKPDRTNLEMFYGCPSRTAVFFFEAVRQVASQVAHDPAGAVTSAAKLSQLVTAVQVVVAAAGRQRAWHQQCFGGAASVAVRGVGTPDWLADAPVRSCLFSLTDHAVELGNEIEAEAPDNLAEQGLVLGEVTELLLNAYAAAAAAADPLTEASLIAQEYAKAQNVSLSALAHIAMQLCNAGAPEGPSLLQRAEGLAEAHHSYKQLVEICRFVGDPSRLYRHMTNMAESAGTSLETGRGLYSPTSCTDYYFSCLLQEGNLGDLMSLPDFLNGPLSHWLSMQADSPELLHLKALHALRLGEYENAATSFITLAGAVPSASAAASAAALAQLAAFASAPESLDTNPQADSRAEEARAFGDLRLIQEQLVPGSGPLKMPEELLEAALAYPDHSGCGLTFIYALSVLAAYGAPFCNNKRPLLDDLWRRLAEVTDWEQVSAQRSHMSDTDFAKLLGRTPLAIAASRCYNPLKRGPCLATCISETLEAEEVHKYLATLPLQGTPDIQAAFLLGLHGGAGSMKDLMGAPAATNISGLVAS